MKPESLIFDIDGTLWDSRAIIAEGYNEVLTQAGYPELCVTAEDLKKLFGKTMTEIGDILLATVPAEQRYPLMERCIDVGDGKLLDDPCDIGYPGVVETLEELSRRYRLFIVSNSQAGYPQTTMEKLGIAHLILRPLLRIITAPLGCLTFGLSGTAIDVLLIYIADRFVKDFDVPGFMFALLTALLINTVTAFVGARR